MISSENIDTNCCLVNLEIEIMLRTHHHVIWIRCCDFPGTTHVEHVALGVLTYKSP